MKNTILVDLDCLLDTRVGTLFSLNPEEAQRILGRGFRNRLSDTVSQFSEVISDAAYKEAYENRSQYTLAQSRPTNLNSELIEQLKTMYLKINTPRENLTDYVIVVNLYPYQFSDVDAANLKFTLEEFLGNDTTVQLCNWLPSSCRLNYLSMRGITDYITYDIGGWIQMQFGGVTCEQDVESHPDISVWGPMFEAHHNAYTTLLSEEPDISDKDDPWEFLKVTLAPFVNLHWLEPRSLSLIDFGGIKE